MPSCGVTFVVRGRRLSVHVPPKKPAKDAALEAIQAWEQACDAQPSRRICVEHAIADSENWRAPAALDRPPRVPARDDPGGWLASVRSRRRLVTCGVWSQDLLDNFGSPVG
jgi:hypothetical protein